MIRARRSFELVGAEATEALGEWLADALAGGEFIALRGELGSGKTTFVRGLARGLGVAETVSSPTYALMHRYEGRLGLWHCDAWLGERPRASLDLDEALRPGARELSVLEWPERIEAALPALRLELEFEPIDAGRRGAQLRVCAAEAGEPSRALAALLALAARPLPRELEALGVREQAQSELSSEPARAPAVGAPDVGRAAIRPPPAPPGPRST